MSNKTATPVTGEQKRRDRAAETDRTAKAFIAAEKAAADKKTVRLREARLAREAAEADAAAAESKPATRRKTKS